MGVGMRYKRAAFGFLNSSSSSSSDEDCEPLSCKHCGVRKFSTNASRRRHERSCESAPGAPAASPDAKSDAAEKWKEDAVTVIFEHGPLGFALDGPDRRTLSTVFKPGHSRAAVQGSLNERAASQLRVGWTLAQVNGKRVRPERDLIMAQIKFAPRPLALTWRTNGIEPPSRADDGQLPGQQTPEGRSAQRRLSLPEFDEARRSLRKTLSASSLGSPVLVSPELPPPPSADEFVAVVRTLRKSLGEVDLQV